MRGFKFSLSWQDQPGITLPGGPPEALVSTEGDGGSLLMGFIAVCLAGLLLSTYYLGWWLQHEPQAAGFLVVAMPVAFLFVAIAGAMQRGRADLVTCLSVLLCGFLAIGLSLLLAADRSASVGLVVVLGAGGAIAGIWSYRSPRGLVRDSPLIVASLQLGAAGSITSRPSIRRASRRERRGWPWRSRRLWGYVS